jgi:hypothetical protein
MIENQVGGSLVTGFRQPINYSSIPKKRAVRRHGITVITSALSVLDRPFLIANREVGR